MPRLPNNRLVKRADVVQNINKICTQSSTTVAFRSISVCVYIILCLVRSLMLLSYIQPASTCATSGAEKVPTRAGQSVSQKSDRQAKRNNCTKIFGAKRKRESKIGLDVQALTDNTEWIKHSHWP